MPVPDIHRPDFTQALVHLTRDRREFVTVESTEPGGRTGFARLEQFAAPPKLERVVPAFDVLKEILSSGTIRGSGNTGFVKGNRPAVCLSEIPLSVMHHFANPPSQEIARYPRYRFYGIALSKRAVFEAGGRPVVYLPDGEADWIPAEEKWRHVRFEHGEVDFTHEREWRVPGDLDLKKMPGLYVIVWSATEAKELAKLTFPVDGQILGILPMEHITMML
jgi:hypothetical protein